MNKEQRIQLIARAINELCPHGHAIEVHWRRYAYPEPDVLIQVHGCKDYTEATAVCRHFGVGDREKVTWNDSPHGRTTLRGQIAPGITLHVFSEGLPPSCRLEKIIERVPKSETRETGDFIEVERTRVVCGEAA